MFNALQKSYYIFSKRPISVVQTAFQYLILNSVVTFAVLGIFISLLLLFSAFHLSMTDFLLPVVAVLFILYSYLSTAILGGAIKAYSNTLNNAKTSYIEFYRYSLNNSLQFFGVYLLQLLPMLIVILPVVGLYIFATGNPDYAQHVGTIETVLYVLGVLLLFAFSCLFFPAFISLSLNRAGIVNALREGMFYIRKYHVLYFIIFSLYAFVWLTAFIPLIQLVTIFVTLPMILSAFIISVQNISGKAQRA